MPGLEQPLWRGQGSPQLLFRALRAPHSARHPCHPAPPLPPPPQASSRVPTRRSHAWPPQTRGSAAPPPSPCSLWGPGGKSLLGVQVRGQGWGHPQGVSKVRGSQVHPRTCLGCLRGAPWVIHRSPGGHSSTTRQVPGGQPKLRWGMHPSLPPCAQDVPAAPHTRRPALPAPAVMRGHPLCPSCTHCTSELDSGHWAPTAEMGPQSRAYGEGALSLARMGVRSACPNTPTGAH